MQYVSHHNVMKKTEIRRTINLDCALKDLVGECVTTGKVLSDDTRARLVALIDVLARVPVVFLIFVDGIRCHAEMCAIERATVELHTS